jgi:hypothetical protein
MIRRGWIKMTIRKVTGDVHSEVTEKPRLLVLSGEEMNLMRAHLSGETEMTLRLDLGIIATTIMAPPSLAGSC